MSGREKSGRLLIGVAVAGVVVSLVGVVIGWRLVDELDTALGRSLDLTGEALVALESSVAAAEEALTLVNEGLASTESTVADLARALDEGEELFDATATLSEDEIAPGLEAVQDTLPGLIDAAAVIDGTLSALAAVPLGPDYDPEVPFDESLRQLQTELEDVPDGLREQAALIREAGGSLSSVRGGTADIAGDLAELQTSLSMAGDLLGTYTDTAAEARTLVADSQAGLEGQLRWARAWLVALGLVIAAGQLVPLGAGWLLLHPDRARALLAEADPPASPGV